jgi:hypothetical protein
MDNLAVGRAIEDLQLFVKGDGASVYLVDYEAQAGRLEVGLDLAGVECLDCVMPPDILAAILTERLHATLDDSVVIVVRDPRVAPLTGPDDGRRS